MRRQFLSAALSTASIVAVGCSKPSVPAVQANASLSPHQYIVLLDLSQSRSSDMQIDGREFIAKLVGELHYGDHITLMQVQQVGLQDHQKHWSHTMFAPDSPGDASQQDEKNLKADQESVKNAVRVLSSTTGGPKVLHTDLFTTLNLAGEYSHDYRSLPTTLVVLSDMFQSANGIEMDRAQRMPPPGWIEKQQQSGLIPKLPNTCVLVVGADSTTREGAKVRTFWQAYFEAAGAKLPAENYRATPPATGDISCS